MDARGGATWCFVEVFILMGLSKLCFVSVVNAGVTVAKLLRNCPIGKSGVDSTGFAGREIRFCGSADSKGLRAGLEVLERARRELGASAELMRSMRDGSRRESTCQ